MSFRMTSLLFACEDLEYVDFEEFRGILVVVDSVVGFENGRRESCLVLFYSRDPEVVCHAQLARLRLQQSWRPESSFWLTANFQPTKTQPLIHHFLGLSLRIYDRAQQTRYEFEEPSSNESQIFVQSGSAKTMQSLIHPSRALRITVHCLRKVKLGRGIERTRSLADCYSTIDCRNK